MEEEREEAQASLLLTLFDHSWFYHQILLDDPPPLPPPSPPHLLPQDKEEVASSVTQAQPSVQRHSRSLSDELSPSEDLCINPPPRKLQTILSGKEAPMAEASETEEEIAQKAERWRRRSEEKLGKRRRRRRRRRQASKSLSDLEFEELRGLMDLGFDFSDADADARLMSIVPALRRRSRTAGYGELAAEASSPASDEVEDAVISRPYLSEAWDAEEDDPLRNWRIPVAAAGVDMKDHLKLWAHTVASAIR